MLKPDRKPIWFGNYGGGGGRFLELCQSSGACFLHRKLAACELDNKKSAKRETAVPPSGQTTFLARNTVELFFLRMLLWKAAVYAHKQTYFTRLNIFFFKNQWERCNFGKF